MQNIWKRPLGLLVVCIMLVFVLHIYILISLFHKKQEIGVLENYENLYFIDDSLITGTILIQILEEFDSFNVQLIVKTKLSDETIYIWNGAEKIDNYDFNMQSSDERFINQNALFRVKIEQTENMISSVLFEQE